MKYPSDSSIEERTCYVVKLLEKATAGEVAAEMMELEGTSTEEGVAELTLAVNEALSDLQAKGKLKMITEADQKIRYFINNRKDENELR